MFFVMLFLSLQLIGAGQHKHVYTESQSDCAACMVAHLPSGAPPPALAVVPVAILVSLPAVILQRYVQVVDANYLTPPSHAPPSL